MELNKCFRTDHVNSFVKVLFPRSSHLTLLWFSFLFFAAGCAQVQDTSESQSSSSLGQISFPTSASGEVQQEFLTGVLALHSFWYAKARDHFREAREMDPTFAMAYWGEAMTRDHPLWRQHEQEEGVKVLNQLDEKIEQGSITWTTREEAYIDALRPLFEPGVTEADRRQNYAAAMTELSEQYPEDQEAAVFQALSAMSVTGFNFNDGDDVLPVAGDLEEVLEQNPEHPGALHYLIHVYDSDTFAENGLPAAEKYAEIAPASSHALHMPSHIFRRLEMWDRVVDSNIEAYQASIDWQQETNRPLRSRDFHAFSWLFEAYLELDNFEAACNLLSELDLLVAQAQDRGETYGNISSTNQTLTELYNERADGSAAECR